MPSVSPNTCTTNQVGIWIRVSTEDQARGESPEHHERRARAYAEARGWTAVKTYHLEGVSGKTIIGHPEAKRMLADVRDGTISGLVFSKLARLARNTRELLEFAEIFKVCGADLISLDEAIDTSSPAGRLFFTMIAAMAQWEREEISSRVAASIPIRAAMGKPTSGSSPFGYRWVNKQLVPDPNEAPVRVLLHELFAEHQRKKTVARILNERGYRTRGGKKFGATTLGRLLEDPTAKGLHRANYTRRDDRTKSTVPKPESEWVWVPVESIVTPELWDRCAVILAQQEATRRPAKKVAHLFAGFAQCSCGQRMYVYHPSPKYVCTGCRNKIPVDDLEAVYRAQLTNFLVEPAEIAAHEAAARNAMEERERLISAAQKEAAKIASDSDRLFELYADGALSKADFAHRFQPLSQRRAQLEAELPRIQAQLDVLRINLVTRTEALDEARALSEQWGDLPFQEKRQIIEAITDRIVVGKDDVEITLLHIVAESPEERDRTQKAAVPFLVPNVPVCLKATKPELLVSESDDLARHLRRRRKEQGIFQSEAGRIMGVCKASVWNWENRRAEPEDYLYPAIIHFLGREPWPEPRTLAECLRAERRRRGITIQAAAMLMEVSHGALANWEDGTASPNRINRAGVSAFLGERPPRHETG